MENIKYCKKAKGLKITNQPLPDYNATQTGRFATDFYGCWWECERQDKTKFWMIGEYPNQL